MAINIYSIKEVKDKIGLVCKQQRKANGLSRSELAEALDVSATTIQNIESGKNSTLDNILKIANHFGLLNSIYDSLNTLEHDETYESLY